MIKHAFSPIVNQQSKILLLGTMPGEQSLKLQQYYGHKGNQFWKLMFTLFNHPYTDDYEIKKQLLLSEGIALWDVLINCEREGSSDSNIKKEVPNDFISFYCSYPSIKEVFFCSGKAAAFYDRYVGRDKKVNYHNLPSPSSANTWKSFDEKIKRVEADFKLFVKYFKLCDPVFHQSNCSC